MITIKGTIVKIESTPDGIVSTVRYWRFSKYHDIALFLESDVAINRSVELTATVVPDPPKNETDYSEFLQPLG